MSAEIKVPVFPESVTDGTLTTWHKKPGDSVSHGEVIVDIETDKVVFEVPSLEDGVVEGPKGPYVPHKGWGTGLGGRTKSRTECDIHGGPYGSPKP